MTLSKKPTVPCSWFQTLLVLVWWSTCAVKVPLFQQVEVLPR